MSPENWWACLSSSTAYVLDRTRNPGSEIRSRTVRPSLFTVSNGHKWRQTQRKSGSFASFITFAELTYPLRAAIIMYALRRCRHPELRTSGSTCSAGLRPKLLSLSLADTHSPSKWFSLRNIPVACPIPYPGNTLLCISIKKKRSPLIFHCTGSTSWSYLQGFCFYMMYASRRRLIKSAAPVLYCNYRSLAVCSVRCRSARQSHKTPSESCISHWGQANTVVLFWAINVLYQESIRLMSKSNNLRLTSFVTWRKL